MAISRALFLCTANSARSQMAEALLRHRAGDRVEAYSAGIEPGALNPLTVQVLHEAGVDTSGLYAKPVDLFLDKVHFDYVVTVCSKAEERCPVFPDATVRMHWPIDDPAAATGSESERLAAFRAARDEIDRRISDWLERLEARPAGDEG